MVNGTFRQTEAFPCFSNKRAFLSDVGISRHPFSPTTNTLMAGPPCIVIAGTQKSCSPGWEWSPFDNVPDTSCSRSVFSSPERHPLPEPCSRLGYHRVGYWYLGRSTQYPTKMDSLALSLVSSPFRGLCNNFAHFFACSVIQWPRSWLDLLQIW